MFNGKYWTPDSLKELCINAQIQEVSPHSNDLNNTIYIHNFKFI